MEKTIKNIKDSFLQYSMLKRVLIICGVFLLSIVFFRQSDAKKYERYLEKKYDKPFEIVRGNRYRCLEPPYNECTVEESWSIDGSLLSFYGRTISFYDDFRNE